MSYFNGIQSKTSNFTIDQNFPSDILLHIFTFLRPQDVLIASIVCKYFARLACDDRLWKHFIAQDFPKESFKVAENDQKQGIYKKIYQQLFTARQTQKNMALEKWLSLFSFSTKREISSLASPKETYQQLCNDLVIAYLRLMGHDYSKLGKVFGISKPPEEDTLFSEHFSFEWIEQAHQEALLHLLKRAVQVERKLVIQYSHPPSLGLQPFQLRILEMVFQEISSPIAFSLCNAGVKNEDLPVFCRLIAEGKISTLNLSSNLISDTGLELLLASARSSRSQLRSLFLSHNAIQKTIDNQFKFNCLNYNLC
jgi:hypothetical protein